MTTDCVVVGGGPAGSITALLLARSGFQVTLLDRQPFPRAKPCGDCVSPPACQLLMELGLQSALLAAQPAPLYGWRVVAPSGVAFSSRFSDAGAARNVTGLALPRETFDAILLEAARSAGVHVLQPWRVEQVLMRNDRVVGVSARNREAERIQVHASLTVGADGLRSTLRQQLGLAARGPQLRKAAVTAHVSGIRGLGELGELHVSDGMSVGLAPIDAQHQLFNMTLVVDAARFGRVLAGKRHDRMRSLLDGFPGLRGRLERFCWRGPLLASGPFDRPVSAVTVPGAALVGDAAGYFDPFTGQGIFQGMAGARLLAHEAARALHARRAGQALHAYAAGHRQLVQGARYVQRLIEFVCARPERANLCIHALSRAPRAAARLMGVTADLRPALSLLSPACLLSFLTGLSDRSMSP